MNSSLIWRDDLKGLFLPPCSNLAFHIVNVLGVHFLPLASCFVLKQEGRIAKSSEFMKYLVAIPTTEKPFQQIIHTA